MGRAAACADRRRALLLPLLAKDRVGEATYLRVLGKLLSVLQFARPLLSIFDRVFLYAQRFPQGKQVGQLPDEVVGE